MRLLLATLHQLPSLRQRRQSPAEAARHRRQLVARVAEGIRQADAGETMTAAEARQVPLPLVTL